MIFRDAIIHWRAYAPWPSDVQVEQDLILTVILGEIYTEPFLAENMAFRGGTCLNKLFWKSPSRYSEDLDFVQINAGRIRPLVEALRGCLDPLFELAPSWEKRKNGFRLYYQFVPEMEGGALRRIKIEINTREHFSVEGYQRRDFKFTSHWKSAQTKVTTFSLNEILATKVRALYQRSKGRDLFDLWKARELKPDWGKTAKIFLKYMEKTNKHVHRDLMNNNLQNKLIDPRFNGDLNALLNSPQNYNAHKAAKWVISEIYANIPK